MNNSNFIQIQVTRNPAGQFQVDVLADGVKGELPDTAPTGRQVLAAAQCEPVVDFVLLQFHADSGLKEVDPDEVPILAPEETQFFALRTDRLFFFVLNDKKFSWGESIPEAILRLLAKAPADAQIWMERRHEGEVLIQPGHSVRLTGDSVERFYSKLPTWKLDVQGVLISSPTPTITVRHALELAEINPDLSWTFILKVAGRPKEQVELTTVLDLRTPGIERLRVMPKVINNGEGPVPRRQFALLEKDENFLNTLPCRWETAIDGERRWLLIHDYPLPVRYQQPHITLAIEMPLLYPSAELDMFYCEPAATLQAGTQIPKTEAQQTIFGKTFQRWSRHRENKVWSPADDSVLTHLGLVEESLLREVVQ